jgi:ferric-dicitrate binding protein FerR (iron transport regulator)
MMVKTPDSLIIKYLEGKATLNETKQIAEWLDIDNKNRLYFITLKKTFIELKLNKQDNNSSAKTAYQKFCDRIEHEEQLKEVEDDSEYSIFSNQFLKYAAILIIFLVVGGGAFLIGRMSNKVQNNSYCEISAPLGGKSSVVLPDGTKIWLNAGSKIKYDGEFNINSRELFLEGEAYFDVSKKKLPFIVHTSDIDIRVFGTSFNVKSYPDEDRIETTLVEGSIRIESKESNEPLYLSPKEKLIFHKLNRKTDIKVASIDTVKETNKVTITEAIEKTTDLGPIEISKNVNTEESVSWKDGSLIFNQESLESLAKKLERKYDITFSFENEDLKNYSFSGTLRDFPLEQVLKAIKFTSPISYTINERNVVLSYNKKFNF